MAKEEDARAKGSRAAELEWLKKGAKVEVNFDEPGFRGSWYTGTVIRPLSKKANKICVEFDTLSADEHHQPSRRLREHVDLIWVRPAPPRETKRCFQLSEDVDAFHKDGWWEGVVTAVHRPSPSSSSPSTTATTYSVFFRSTREQLQFPESDLRLHREWVYGEWVPPLESQPPPTPHHSASS